MSFSEASAENLIRNSSLLHLLQLKRFHTAIFSLRSQGENRISKFITLPNSRAFFRLQEGLKTSAQNVDIKMQTHFSAKDGKRSPLYLVLRDNSMFEDHFIDPLNRDVVTASKSESRNILSCHFVLCSSTIEWSHAEMTAYFLASRRAVNSHSFDHKLRTSIRLPLVSWKDAVVFVYYYHDRKGDFYRNKKKKTLK
ncbi:unnamed protein product [Albugo candida]|uniref:Uncharacterized protein n=1 Tax=Albugo candida TaxID=65357 RepID=A0A024G2S4_9STRA|nr:unnamed protein product [Albugo candida]|eukprot:CCI41070.1 unnamed protein product [Albugo candida]